MVLIKERGGEREEGGEREGGKVMNQWILACVYLCVGGLSVEQCGDD